MAKLRFEDAFKILTGDKPFPWQQRLYEHWFAKGKFPSACNIPTGLGKTSVVAVWLIALANHRDKLPRRLVHVVNRRTVVDQTTTEVERLRANGDLFRSLARAQGLDTGLSTGLAITPLVLGDSLIAVALGQELFTRGINVQPIIHPAVPEKSARLRFFVTSEHREDQIRETIAAASEALKAIGDGKSILTRAK